MSIEEQESLSDLETRVAALEARLTDLEQVLAAALEQPLDTVELDTTSARPEDFHTALLDRIRARRGGVTT